MVFGGVLTSAQQQLSPLLVAAGFAAGAGSWWLAGALAIRCCWSVATSPSRLGMPGGAKSGWNCLFADVGPLPWASPAEPCLDWRCADLSRTRQVLDRADIGSRRWFIHQNRCCGDRAHNRRMLRFEPLPAGGAPARGVIPCLAGASLTPIT